MKDLSFIYDARCDLNLSVIFKKSFICFNMHSSNSNFKKKNTLRRINAKTQYKRMLGYCKHVY